MPNYKDASSCAFCRRGSTAIQIAGDQFLTENVIVESASLSADDAPRWLSAFNECFAGRGILRAHCVAAPKTREIYIDIESALGAGEANDFLTRVDRVIRQVIPASLSRIIYVDDPGSRALAERVRSVYSEIAGEGRAIELTSDTAVNSDIPKHHRNFGTTIVVAGCAASGRRLLAMSQALRVVQGNKSVHYLVGISRLGTAEHFKYIKSNLQFGDAPEDFDFHSVLSIQLPDDSPSRYSPWHREVRLLKHLERHTTDEKLRSQISGRISLIQSSENRGGLSNELFWPSPAGSILKLRPNFAFWKFAYADKDISQADVYLTITSLLHAKRTGGANRSRWTQHEHRRVVIAPRVFDRYNDGVIQASLLRASMDEELDYSCSTIYSLAMLDVLTFVISNLTNEAGEATVEFLLAVAVGKLRLQRSHIDELLKLPLAGSH
jgi:hypothetical protein